MTTSTMVHVRVDEKLKVEAAETLASMGLTISDAVRVFLLKVIAEKQMPFSLQVPNRETLLAMSEADEMAKAQVARFKNTESLLDEIEKNIGK